MIRQDRNEQILHAVPDTKLWPIMYQRYLLSTAIPHSSSNSLTALWIFYLKNTKIKLTSFIISPRYLRYLGPSIVGVPTDRSVRQLPTAQRLIKFYPLPAHCIKPCRIYSLNNINVTRNKLLFPPVYCQLLF